MRSCSTLVVLLLAGCSCRSGIPSADDGSFESESDQESGLEGETQETSDLPQEGDCEDSFGEALLPANADWSWQTGESRTFRLALVHGSTGYLEAVVGGGEPIQIHEVDLVTGEVRGSTTVSPRSSGASYYLHPSGELLRFESEGHRLYVQRFQDYEMVDEVQLSDDHPKLGWDGGWSGVSNVSVGEEQFSVLGVSRGYIDPESPKQTESRWRKTYQYGEPQPLTIDFVWPELPGQNSGGSAWVENGLVVSVDASLLHLTSDGSELERLDGLVGLFVREASAGRTLWRRTEETSINAEGKIDVLSELHVNPTFELEELWRDNHCSHRWLQSAGFVAGGEEVVLFAQETEESTSGTTFIHRIHGQTGEVLDTFEFAQQSESLLSGAVFETDDGDIGVLFYGAEEVESTYRATARAFFPFE